MSDNIPTNTGDAPEDKVLSAEEQVEDDVKDDDEAAGEAVAKIAELPEKESNESIANAGVINDGTASNTNDSTAGNTNDGTAGNTNDSAVNVSSNDVQGTADNNQCTNAEEEKIENNESIHRAQSESDLIVLEEEKETIEVRDTDDDSDQVVYEDIWSGDLEWLESNKKTKERITRNIQCSMRRRVKNGIEPDYAVADLKATSWPKKLTLKFLSKTLLQEKCSEFLANAKVVDLEMQMQTPCEHLESLIKLMKRNLSACVHFKGMPNKAANDVTLWVIVYDEKQNAFTGYLPNDQSLFVKQFIQLFQKQKTESKTNQQQAAAASATSKVEETKDVQPKASESSNAITATASTNVVKIMPSRKAKTRAVAKIAKELNPPPVDTTETCMRKRLSCVCRMRLPKIDGMFRESESYLNSLPPDEREKLQEAAKKKSKSRKGIDFNWQYDGDRVLKQGQILYVLRNGLEKSGRLDVDHKYFHKLWPKALKNASLRVRGTGYPYHIEKCFFRNNKFYITIVSPKYIQPLRDVLAEITASMPKFVLQLEVRNHNLKLKLVTFVVMEKAKEYSTIMILLEIGEKNEGLNTDLWVVKNRCMALDGHMIEVAIDEASLRELVQSKGSAKFLNDEITFCINGKPVGPSNKGNPDVYEGYVPTKRPNELPANPPKRKRGSNLPIISSKSRPNSSFGDSNKHSVHQGYEYLPTKRTNRPKRKSNSDFPIIRAKSRPNSSFGSSSQVESSRYSNGGWNGNKRARQSSPEIECPPKPPPWNDPEMANWRDSDHEMSKNANNWNRNSNRDNANDMGGYSNNFNSNERSGSEGFMERLRNFNSLQNVGFSRNLGLERDMEIFGGDFRMNDSSPFGSGFRDSREFSNTQRNNWNDSTHRNNSNDEFRDNREFSYAHRNNLNDSSPFGGGFRESRDFLNDNQNSSSFSGGFRGNVRNMHHSPQSGFGNNSSFSNNSHRNDFGLWSNQGQQSMDFKSFRVQTEKKSSWHRR